MEHGASRARLRARYVDQSEKNDWQRWLLANNRPTTPLLIHVAQSTPRCSLIAIKEPADEELAEHLHLQLPKHVGADPRRAPKHNMILVKLPCARIQLVRDYDPDHVKA